MRITIEMSQPASVQVSNTTLMTRGAVDRLIAALRAASEQVWPCQTPADIYGELRDRVTGKPPEPKP